MSDENKISINVEISDDGKNQINQYVQAFDNLRDSVNGLSKPLNSFSNNLNSISRDLSKYTDSINKLNSQNQELISSGDKITNKLSDASTSFSTWGNIIVLVTETLKSWQIALSGGLAVLTTFLPEIIKFATALFQGKEAINAMVQNLKNLNDVMGQANKDAASQTTRLQILYRSATDVNNANADRIKSVKELKNEFPEYLGHLKDEDILNGKAKKNYDDLSKSIFENAKAKAALNKITDEANKMLDADFKIQKIQNANYNEVKRKTDEYNRRLKSGRFAYAKSILDDYKKDSDERAKLAIDEQNQIKGAIQQNIQYLEKFAGGTNKIANSINRNNDDNNTYIPEKSKSPKKPKQPAEKPRPDTQELEARSINFAKTIEQDKQDYDTEQALLQEQLDKKLITQEQYNQQSDQLQEKYHLAVGQKVKVFNATELADVQKHMEAMVAAQQHDDVMDKDKQNVKKAILPAEKLNAEKQLISDKYNYEITLAAGNTEKIKQLEEQKQQDITALTQQYEQERKEFALQTAQQVSNTAFGMLKSSIQSQADAKIKSLETQKQAELSNSNLTADQKRAIEDKYKKKEAEEKVKAFKAEQKASILQAVINGALAITKATSQTGVLAPFVIPGIIVETAIQVATIAKQKAPQYAKGGLHYQSDGRGALLSGYSHTDDTNAYLRSGEAVVVSEAMRNPWARNLVSAINVAHGGRDFSISNPGRGYAIGGIFTDGGNANRYYSQPANDQKDLANTLAYQMINNFPPIYVDVKDVNNQQNILAQTVNRVNL